MDIWQTGWARLAFLLAMRVIGIAGPAGAEKTAVAKLLARRPGFARVDCDKLAWDSYRRGGPAYDRILARFGKGILQADGSVDRAKLAALVFSDAQAKRDLEIIVHPLVMEGVGQAMERERQAGTEVLLVEGALLLSSPHVDLSLFDQVAWLDVPEAERRRRLLASGLAPKTAELRLAAQRDLAPLLDPKVVVIDGRGAPKTVAQNMVELGGVRYKGAPPAQRLKVVGLDLLVLGEANPGEARDRRGGLSERIGV